MNSTSSLPLFRRVLADSWRSLIGWSLGIIAVLSLYLPLYPALGGEALKNVLASLPPELVKTIGYDNITSGAGYAQSTFYGLLGFLLVAIAATSWGTSAIAGDEETGSLELTLAHGVSRTQLVLERSLALAVRVLWFGVLSGGIILALNGSAQLEIKPINVLAITASYVGLGLVIGLIAVAVGALTGRRVYALAAGAGLAILGYALNAVANQNADLEWLHAISPYHWAYGASPLINGADWGGLGLLYGLAILLLGIAVVGLRRRDIAS